MAELLVILLLCAALIGVAAVVAVRRRQSGPGSSSTDVTGRALADHTEVTLPVDDADPAAPATQRFVAEAARRALDEDPDATTIVVRSAGGRELGRVHRTETPAPKPFVDLPNELLEPHARRHTGPGDPVQQPATPAGVRFSDEPRREQPQPHRSLADHFDLSDGVRQRITAPDDVIDIVRAILDASGVSFDVHDNVIVQGDRALVMIRTPLHGAVGTEQLDAAYLRFERSRARRGVVVTPGTVYPHEVRRREALAPALLHAGADGIQRMADAVAIGANPLDFVLGVSPR